MCIVRHGFPFNFVEYKWVRELLSYINSDVKHVSRNTLVSSLLKLHGEMKEKLKYVIHKCHNRICLTSDCWTACTQEGKILAFCKLEPPHTGEDLANKVFEVLTEWEIDRKIFSITLDNASANDRMQELLGEQLRLQNSLLCDGEFLHVRCCAHVLNLIVQDGLKVVEVSLQKIRDSIKYVRASESRKIVFTLCIAQVRGIDTKVGLRLDVPTRWNSTYIMLESALKYRRAFASFTIRDRKYKCCPSNDKWKRTKKLCEFLKPFYKMTNLISGTSYPTSNEYFMQVWKIEWLLRETLKCDDPVLQNMAVLMMEKFGKYWSDYNVILSIAMILDPRMKLEALRFYYSKLDASTCDEKINNIKEKMYKLFDEYVSVKSSSSTASSSQQPTVEEGFSIEENQEMDDPYDEYINYVSQNVNVNGKYLYLAETPLEPKFFPKLDILSYWKDRQERYPNLCRLACEVLSIPITTVASESAFSIGARVLNKYRASLLPSNVQALILTQNWINGFEDIGNLYFFFHNF
uniref:HAT C-terminal dimerisation domain-containing protein n=1 Tax=Glycine max TaxID=3847 RepID=A0A0R0HSA4_SOYBN